MQQQPIIRNGTRYLTWKEAQQYGKAIQLTGKYWTTLYGHQWSGSVIEVRSRVRPYPLIKRCLTFDDCKPFLPVQQEPEEHESTIVNPSLTDFASACKRLGSTSMNAQKWARENGFTFANGSFRSLWNAL